MLNGPNQSQSASDRDRRGRHLRGGGGGDQGFQGPSSRLNHDIHGSRQDDRYTTSRNLRSQDYSSSRPTQRHTRHQQAQEILDEFDRTFSGHSTTDTRRRRRSRSRLRPRENVVELDTSCPPEPYEHGRGFNYRDQAQSTLHEPGQVSHLRDDRNPPPWDPISVANDAERSSLGTSTQPRQEQQRSLAINQQMTGSRLRGQRESRPPQGSTGSTKVLHQASSRQYIPTSLLPAAAHLTRHSQSDRTMRRTLPSALATAERDTPKGARHGKNVSLFASQHVEDAIVLMGRLALSQTSSNYTRQHTPSSSGAHGPSGSSQNNGSGASTMGTATAAGIGASSSATTLSRQSPGDGEGQENEDEEDGGDGWPGGFGKTHTKKRRLNCPYQAREPSLHCLKPHGRSPGGCANLRSLKYVLLSFKTSQNKVLIYP